MTRIIGSKEVSKTLMNLGVDIDRVIRESVYGVAQNVRSHAVKSIATVSVGQTVTRYTAAGNPYDHIASKGGDAPNSDTGTLIRSIAIEPQKPAMSIGVGTNTEYAKFLEFGTERMVERPFLLPAMEAQKRTMKQEVEKAINRQIAEQAK
jgi:HK97 gp10 family phage protein